MTGRVRVGVVGCGYWGPNLIRSLTQIPEVSVEVVCDRDAIALAGVKGRYPTVGSFTTDLSQVFEMGLDALVVATPPASHYEIAASALESGLDVLVEKPLTMTSEESLSLIALAERREQILMVAHIVEYNPGVRALKDIVASGELGEIRYLDGIRAGLGIHRPDVNVLWDLGPHEFSIFMLLLEESPQSVNTQGISCVQDSVEDVIYVTLRFPSGVLAHTRLSWLDPHKTRKITVVGSHKMAVYNDLAAQENLRIYDKRVDHIRATDTYGEYQFAYHDGSVVSPHVELSEPLLVECQQFVESVMTRREPPTDGVNGLKVVRILEAANRSLELGGENVTIPPVTDLTGTLQLRKASSAG